MTVFHFFLNSNRVLSPLFLLLASPRSAFLSLVLQSQPPFLVVLFYRAPQTASESCYVIFGVSMTVALTGHDAGDFSIFLGDKVYPFSLQPFAKRLAVAALGNLKTNKTK
jgi:hypothetical protein